MVKIVKYFFQSLLIFTFFLICRIIGLKFSRIIFSNLFVLVGPLFRSKKIIKRNLNIASKVISNLNEKKIVKNMWKNYGMTFVEYIFLKRFREKNSHITINDLAGLSEISNKKKPAIFISGHFANFELMSMEITKRNISLATIYRPLNNVFLNSFMESLRKKFICKNQIKKGVNGVRESIDYLKKNHCLALMIDQRVSEGKEVDFFNQAALTTTLPAQLSIKFNLDIIPVFIERDKDNNFQIEFQEKIVPSYFKNKIDLTRKLNNVLENMIKKNPNQWIWTHNRWK
tara:strand:+ start:526 stop:1383 length:858 start_codon:yes stop_codon:yes gene_type:complete